MLTQLVLLILGVAASVLGAPAARSENAQVLFNAQAPEQASEWMSKSDQGQNIIINVFGGGEVEPMCRPNGIKCKFNSSCCSGYCSWHQGYKCVDKSKVSEEEISEEDFEDTDSGVEPMCRPDGKKCRFNSSCCSGYCSWHQGYKCVDKTKLLEEEYAEADPGVEPMCRPNGINCKFNSSCCSGYCSWHQGYKCVDKAKALAAGIEL